MAVGDRFLGALALEHCFALTVLMQTHHGIAGGLTLPLAADALTQAMLSSTGHPPCCQPGACSHHHVPHCVRSCTYVPFHMPPSMLPAWLMFSSRAALCFLLQARTDAYRTALERNPKLLSGARVLDVGCGTGILSLFAARGGAAQVVGVDGSERIAALAQQVSSMLSLVCLGGWVVVEECKGWLTYLALNLL